MSLGMTVWFDYVGKDATLSAESCRAMFPFLDELPVSPVTPRDAIRRAEWHGFPFRVEMTGEEGGYQDFAAYKIAGDKATGSVDALPVGFFSCGHGVIAGVDNVATDRDSELAFDRFIQYARDRLGTYDSRQIRMVMISVIRERWNGVSLRDQGGVYFVPHQYRDELLQVATAGKDAGFRIRLVDCERTKEGIFSIAGAVEDSLNKQMEETQAKLDAMKSEKPGALRNRLAETQQILSMARLYEQLLGVQQKELVSAARALEEKLFSDLGVG